jgi:hypothetical protein
MSSLRRHLNWSGVTTAMSPMRRQTSAWIDLVLFTVILPLRVDTSLSELIWCHLLSCCLWDGRHQLGLVSFTVMSPRRNGVMSQLRERHNDPVSFYCNVTSKSAGPSPNQPKLIWSIFWDGRRTSRNCSGVIYCILDIQGLQSDRPLTTLGLNSSQFCSRSSIKHSARRTRLLWPFKLNHYLRQWSVFIWRNSQRIYSTLPAYMHCIQWDPRTSYF